MATKVAKVTSEDRVQTQIRMGVTLRKRIDGYRERIKREQGLEIPFSAAVRTLLEKGLDVA